MNTGCRALSDREVTLLQSKLTLPRDRLLFALGIQTGYRIKELLSIEVADLYEVDGSLKNTLTISRRNMKGKQAGRTVPLHRHTVTLLEQYLNSLKYHQKYLFTSQKGSVLSRIRAWVIIKSAANACGLKGKVACHSMRKTVAVRAYKASGKDLVLTQKLMGHASINSTISYLQVGSEEIENLWARLASEGKLGEVAPYGLLDLEGKKK